VLVPANPLIVYIELILEGIGTREALSKKIITIYDLCKR
jgi:hypothetical protein